MDGQLYVWMDGWMDVLGMARHGMGWAAIARLAWLLLLLYFVAVCSACLQADLSGGFGFGLANSTPGPLSILLVNTFRFK